MIKIRMARGGRVHAPVYTIVAADSRFPRDGRFLEKLGQYSPKHSEELKNLKVDALTAWIKKGAVLSDTVRTLLKKNKVEISLD